MSDLAQVGAWLAVLLAGLGAVTLAWRLGLPRTLARDALHVGTGVWVVGWLAWASPWAPIALTVAAAVGVALVPRVAASWKPARALRDAVSGDDERWTGLVAYTVSFAVFTAVGLLWNPWAAGAALWALCLGDGLGGLVGRRWGRHTYQVRGAKKKSLEGSLIVAVGAAVAVLLAGAWFGASPGPVLVGAAGIGAAASEAVAPRASDNVLVPLAVFVIAAVGG